MSFFRIKSPEKEKKDEIVKELKRSQSKTLKIIDWFIDVPEKVETVGEKFVRSSISNIEFKGVTTKWNLIYVFSFGETGECYVFLECCSNLAEINFDCCFYSSIMNGSHTIKIHIPKSKWSETSDVSNNFGVALIPLKILIKNREELCPGGKLHLRTKIGAIKITSEDSIISEIPKIELMNNELTSHQTSTQSEEIIFNMITTASDPDVFIKTDDGIVLKAHKSILSEKSSVFQSMFTIDMEEAASQSVDIIEFKGPVMKELLRFIYFGKVRDLEQVNMELFKAAKTYEIARLPDICLKSIMDEGINYKNVIDIVQLTYVYDVHHLFTICCDKIQTFRNHHEIEKKLKMLDSKLQIKIMEQIIRNLAKHEIHITVETCDLEQMNDNAEKFLS